MEAHSSSTAVTSPNDEAGWEELHLTGGVRMQRFPRGSRLRLWNFRVAGVEIKPEHRRALALFARRLVRRAGPDGLQNHVIIRGHASGSGSAAFNQRLAGARASRVREALGAALRAAMAAHPSLRGLSPPRIEHRFEIYLRRVVVARAAGASEPISRDASPAELARDRRVELREI